MIVVILIVSLIPFISIEFINISYSYNSLSSQKDKELKTIIIDLAAYANSILHKAKSVVEELASNPLTKRTSADAASYNESQLWSTYEGKNWDIEQNLTNLKFEEQWNPDNDIDPEFSLFLNEVSVTNNFSEIFITDARGLVYASSQSVPGDFLQKDEDWWIACLQTSSRTFIEFGYDNSTNQFLMDIITSVNLDNGTFVGMIKAGYDVTDFSKELQAAIVSDTILIFSINTEGKMFTHPNSSLVGEEAVRIIPITYQSNKEIVDELMNETLSTGNCILWIDNIEFRTGYSSIGNWDIVLFIIEKASIINNAIIEQLYISIGLFLFAIIIIVIGTLILSYSLVQPVVTISALSKEVADGNLSVDVANDIKERNDEYGELAKSFSVMIENLRNQISLLRLQNFIVDNLEEGIVLEDNEEFITFVNPRIVEMSGYKEEELIRKKTSIFLPKDELVTVEKETSKRPAGIISRYETVFLSKDGIKTPVLITGGPIFSDDGNFNGVLSVVTDISEQKKWQLVKDRFIASTSHELRTPVTIIKGYIEFLLKDPDIPKARKKRIYDSLSRSINRLVGLIENVHEISTDKTSFFDIVPHTVNLNVFSRILQEQLHLLYPRRQIIVNQVHLINEETVIFDEDKILQAIHNLVSNAIKNSSKDSIVEITLFLKSKGLTVSVQDFGVGIHFQDIFYLFQPFSHKDTTYSSKGSGLGLFIVKNIVLAHRGYIEFHSEQILGSTFVIVLHNN